MHNGADMIPTTTIILTTTTRIIEELGGTAPSARAVPTLPLGITTPPADVPSTSIRIRMWMRVAYLKATGCLASRSPTFSLLH